MENHASPEPDARVRLTHDQAQELILHIVATQAESLLRTAYRNSLCEDDAHDAYQRAMEIFLRRARTLDPASAHKWLHVVVKRESLEIRRGRLGSVTLEAIDFELHSASEVSTPEERVLNIDRSRQATEALRRLKPQELRAIWLKAVGHSYAEIADTTGYSPTKVNRCLAEGRKSFLERFEGIEAGAECARWHSVLAAMAEGGATAAQITDARPHLRNCAACRAMLRGLHRSHRPLKAVLPVGLVSAGAKLSGLLERLLGGLGGGGDAGGAAAGGAGFLGVGGAKLAGLLAAGAATAGGGLVVAQQAQHDPGHHAAAVRTAHAAAVAAGALPVRSAAVAPVRAAAATAATRKSAQAHRAVAWRRSVAKRSEFAPRGLEPISAPVVRATARAVRATAPRAIAAEPDSTRGEFAPQP